MFRTFLYVFFFACRALSAWTFQIAASTETKVPGQPFHFGAFGSIGVAADNFVYFIGYSGSTFSGLYRDTIPPSDLIAVSDTSHNIPPITSNNKSLGAKFDFFQLGSSTSTTKSLMTFVGGSYAVGASGIFLSTLEGVASTFSVIPHQQNVEILKMQACSLNDEHVQLVVFVADVLDRDTQEQDDYLLLSSPKPEGRELRVLANHQTVIPDSPNLHFTMIAGSVAVDGLVVFFGSNFVKSAANSSKAHSCTGHLPDSDDCVAAPNGPWPGLYLFSLSSGTLSTLVDSTMLAPGSSYNYNAFSDPNFDGATVAFIAAFGSHRGLFVYSLKEKKDFMVVNFESLVPGTSIPFATFPHIPSIKGDVLVFYGATASPNQKYGGVFRAEMARDDTGRLKGGAVVTKVMSKVDTFAGYNVYLLTSSFDAYNGNNVAFFAALVKNGKQIEAVVVGSYQAD